MKIKPESTQSTVWFQNHIANMTPDPKKGQQNISSEMTSTKDQGQLTEEPEIRKRKKKQMNEVTSTQNNDTR